MKQNYGMWVQVYKYLLEHSNTTLKWHVASRLRSSLCIRVDLEWTMHEHLTPNLSLGQTENIGRYEYSKNVCMRRQYLSVFEYTPTWKVRIMEVRNSL